jgi:hypothetical protein
MRNDAKCNSLQPYVMYKQKITKENTLHTMLGIELYTCGPNYSKVLKDTYTLCI